MFRIKVQKLQSGTHSAGIASKEPVHWPHDILTFQTYAKRVL